MKCRYYLGVVVAVLSHTAWAGDPATDHFESKIRPVLIEHCYPCHSALAKKSKGGLTLDTAQALRLGGETGPAIAPNKPADSLLIRAIQHSGELKMPPKGKLTAGVIADFEKWIADGAIDPRDSGTIKKTDAKHWWSFQPLRPVAPPTVADNSATPIDRFLLHKLNSKGLSFAKPADRRTLIRRVYLDVVGLPPTPQQVNDFIADNSPRAYETVVDRLLASPQFGERWARHWLDVARYAESSGYEHDNDRPHAYQYRDFVIQALNRDLPFDQFAQWQIAGDELAPENPLAVKATGFLAAGLMNGQVTEREAVKERYEVLDDWVGTIGTAFLGLTVGCARCHDHKFDPIPTKDYYRLAANFTSAVRVNLNVPHDASAMLRAIEQHREKLHRLALDKAAWERSAKVREWLDGQPEMPAPPWLVLQCIDAATGKTRRGLRSDQQLIHLDDDSYTFAPLNGDVGPISFTAKANVERIKFVRVEALTDDSLPNYGPGFGHHGEFTLNSLALNVAPANSKSPAKKIKLDLVKSTTGQKPGGAGWTVSAKHAGRYQAAVFSLAEPVGFADGAELRFTLSCPGDSPGGRKTIGRFRISIGAESTPPELDGPRMGHDEFVRGVGDVKTGKVSEASAKLFCLNENEWRRLDAEWRREQTTWKRPAYDVVFGVSEGLTPARMMIQGPDLYDTTNILARGDANRPDGEAIPGFLSAISRSDESRWRIDAAADSRTTMHRAALGKWLTDVERGAGPLTARVIVNRLWHHHFGRGIVATPSDFGAQGDAPSHPELLDYLAGELIAGRWSLKTMHKKILMSAAYRQSGERSALADGADPDNHLLHRFAPRRLEAEAIRDSMLAVSGRLNEKMFGAGTLDEAMTRRSIYFAVKRSKLIPSMVQLDWPEALTGIGKRNTTIVPPQALWAMNNPHVRANAAALAKALETRDANEFATRTYERTLGRSPTPDELAAAASFLGRSPTDDMQTDFCQTLFMLNEFVYIR